METASTVTVENTKTVLFRGIVTPRPLLPDEIIGIVSLEELQGVPISDIIFLESPNCSLEQITEYVDRGFFPIEVGKMSYKSTNNSRNQPAGSATEAVLINLGYEDPADRTAGENKLVELMARRNEKGHLNKGHMSIPRILGHLYDLGYGEIDLIERFKDVVRVFRDDINRKAGGTPPAREDSLMTDQLPDLFRKIEFREETQETKKCQFSPFTPDRYLRDLWRLGTPIDEIQRKVSFWIEAWNRFQEEYRKAKTEWESGKILRIEFSVNGLSGAAVETDNRFVAKVAAPTVNVLINRRTDGHGAIMTLGRNLSTLSQELNRIEPSKWYYHKPAGHLINGGGSLASDLALDQIIQLVKKFMTS